MNNILRILTGLLGLLFLLAFGNWLLNPETAVAAIGMPLLTGIAGNSQIGDLSAFFFCCAVFILMGAWRQQASWLVAASFLLGGAALFRVTAAAVHDTDLLLSAVVGEAVATAVLLVYAARLKIQSDA